MPSLLILSRLWATALRRTSAVIDLFFLEMTESPNSILHTEFMHFIIAPFLYRALKDGSLRRCFVRHLLIPFVLFIPLPFMSSDFSLGWISATALFHKHVEIFRIVAFVRGQKDAFIPQNDNLATVAVWPHLIAHKLCHAQPRSMVS